MNAPGDLRERDDALLRRRLLWLMVGRLVVSSVVLAITFTFGTVSQLTSFTPQFLLAIATATYGASLVFAFTLPKSGKALDRAAGIQLAWDILMASSLMYISGGIGSAFTFLFGSTILMASLIVGPVATRITSVCSLGAFFAIGIPVAQGWLPAPPDQELSRYLLSAERLAFPLLANVIALLLVALLSNMLSERLHQTRGQLQEATESAQSLARLNSNIVQSLMGGLLTTNLEGIVQTINPAGAAMFEETEDSLRGRALTDLLPVTDESSAGRGEGQAGLDGGRTFPVGFTVNKLFGSGHEVIGRLVTFQDLTEIEKLREAAERAERLATLGRLSAGLAHEIRNPLSSIRGSVELVREGEGLPSEDRRLLSIVLREAQRLDELVTTMLQAGAPKAPHIVETDLAAVAREVTEVARASHESLGVAAVACELKPVSVFADGDQLRQVVWNLLKNAIQASPEDGTVTVVTKLEGDEAIVEVQDEGRGIASDEQSRLFETFYSKRPQGVGIGLALVHQIVNAHAGTIEVESAPGQGATFRVRLPSGGPDTGLTPRLSDA